MRDSILLSLLFRCISASLKMVITTAAFLKGNLTMYKNSILFGVSKFELLNGSPFDSIGKPVWLADKAAIRADWTNQWKRASLEHAPVIYLTPYGLVFYCEDLSDYEYEKVNAVKLATDEANKKMFNSLKYSKRIPKEYEELHTV